MGQARVMPEHKLERLISTSMEISILVRHQLGGKQLELFRSGNELGIDLFPHEILDPPSMSLHATVLPRRVRIGY
eukprot:5044254-Heterocapsa_arctica.AAC.1